MNTTKGNHFNHLASFTSPLPFLAEEMSRPAGHGLLVQDQAEWLSSLTSWSFTKVLMPSHEESSLSFS
ncbi:hypothetical protein LINPERHAP1_LOCUS15556 [Linum perenne]